MNTELLSELEFEFSMKPTELEEFSHILVDFKGQAVMWDDEAEEKIIAIIKGHRLDLTTARTQHNDMRELFDSISQEISDLGEHIVRDNNCFVECCSRDEKEETPCASLVYIDEILVEKDYRNNRVGTELLKRMSEVLDLNKTLVALKAYPIMDDDEQKRSPELKKKLKNFYTKLGFRYSGEHYMVKDARDCFAQRARALAEAGV